LSVAREHPGEALFKYIDGWYNTQRIQKRLGWLSPDEYETAWRLDQAQHDNPANLDLAPTGGR